jgi:hypothetical protein
MSTEPKSSGVAAPRGLIRGNTTETTLVASQTATAVLPDVFSGPSFSKPEGWSDKALAKRVNFNPISDLCLRLATSDPGPRNLGCYDPRRAGLKVSGPSRLYQMIGKKVGRPTFLRMCSSSPRQWKFVEECWIANMHTVLLNREFDPVRLDRKLFKSILKYKIWFLRFFFAGSVKRVFDRKTNRRRFVFFPINFDRGLRALKDIAGYLQWAALSDMKDYNRSPPTIPYWIGYRSQFGSLELVWFGGHLNKWRSCLYDLKFSDEELANLCQIRTFGRALPCPTKQMCESAFKSQVEILRTEKEIDPKILRVVKSFSKRLGERLSVWEMPTHTHISVSTSGCFERSQQDGGLASEVKSWIEDLDVSLSNIVVEWTTIPGSWASTLEDEVVNGLDLSELVDCFGDKLFPRPRGFYQASRAFRANSSSEELTFLDILFGSTGMSTKRRLVKKIFKSKDILPNSLGRVVLWLASVRAERQGHFIDENGLIVHPALYLTIGKIKYPVYFKNQMEYHLTYSPVEFPSVSLDCLAEPGAKTRPLGKNQAWFTMVTRAMRFMAEPILARDGRARIGLRSTNKMWSFLKFIKNSKINLGEETVCQSSDFSSATDHIGLSLIEAMWDGFCSSLPKSHPFWVYYKLIVCPRAMFSPKKFRTLNLFEDGSPNKCGSFMGEPMSFLTLTLTNLLIEEISFHYYLSSGELWSNTIAPDLVGDPTCICGDDVAAIRRSVRQSLLFKEVANDIGMVFSWKDGLSKRVLIFCEDHAILSESSREVLYIDVIKSRLLTTMAREHSENRSSILGKGRALGNQLDYFENNHLKIAILGYFYSIFVRVYKDSLLSCKLPLYLPPCCGGLGIPIVETIMPEYMWPYIGYIFEVLNIEDYFERYCALEELSALNSRVKHGLSIKDSNILRSECARYKHNVSKVGINFRPNVIYSDDDMYEILDLIGTNVPLDPYIKKRDFSSLKNEAARIGFVQFSSLSEEIERILNFNEFFSRGVTREQRTFNKWGRDSKKFWKNKFRGRNLSLLSQSGKTGFKSIADLEKRVTRGFSGWIFIGDSDDAFNLVNSGPSLKIEFRAVKSSSIHKVHGYRDSDRALEGTRSS